jgi:16S rRNA (cytosine1402-N4)-methyltransferase
VNGEFDQLVEGLAAAERALKPDGMLAVVTFHSLEDRIVKRYLRLASGAEANTNRYSPARAEGMVRFELVTKKAVGPNEDELVENPRSRSAKLRVARRTDVPAVRIDGAVLGLPKFTKKGRR